MKKKIIKLVLADVSDKFYFAAKNKKVLRNLKSCSLYLVGPKGGMRKIRKKTFKKTFPLTFSEQY